MYIVIDKDTLRVKALLKHKPIKYDSKKELIIQMSKIDIYDKDCLIIKKDNNNNILVEIIEPDVCLELLKHKYIKQINLKAKIQIQQMLSDWGDSYEECISELNQSYNVYESKLIDLLDISLDQLKRLAYRVLDDDIDIDTIIKIYKEEITNDEYNTIKHMLESYVEIVKLMNKVEDVWSQVEILENVIKEINDIKSLKSLEMEV